MRILRLTVTPNLAGCSVGRLLRQEMHLSSSLLKSLKWRENAILLNGHPVTVRAAVKPGDILNFTGRIVYTGKTSLVVHVKAVSVMTGEQAIEGFATFVTVQEGIGGKLIHGIVLDKAEDEEELSLRERALKYVKK